MDQTLKALGVTYDDLPISHNPIEEWTTAQLARAARLLEFCRTTYGIGESRKLFPLLGLPVPPEELWDPLRGEQRRQ